MTPAEVLAVEIRQFASVGDPPLRTLVPRVIGQTEQARVAKASLRSTVKSTPISREEFLDAVPAHRRDVALTILRVAEEAGFVATDYRSAVNARVRILLPGVTRTPISLGPDYLWVGFGGGHGDLADHSLSDNIRQAVLRVAPSHKQAADPKKGSVYIPLDAIALNMEEPLRAMFSIVRTGLEQGQAPSGGDGVDVMEDLLERQDGNPIAEQ